MTPLSVSYSSHIPSVKIVSSIEAAINTTKQCVFIYGGTSKIRTYDQRRMKTLHYRCAIVPNCMVRPPGIEPGLTA